MNLTQLYCCVIAKVETLELREENMSPIPKFHPNGNLPPGVHTAEWDELVSRFETNDQRRKLISGLLKVCQELKFAGCSKIYLDGSFITVKDSPSDFDACWETNLVDHETLLITSPSLFDFRNKRALQKLVYGGELFPSTTRADAKGTTYLEFFQRDKNTGEQKGIIALNLGDLP